MKTTTELAIVAAGLGVVAFVVYRSSRAVAGAVTGAAQAVNPANPENVFAGAVNSAGRAATGDRHWTLGGWLYELANKGAPGKGISGDLDTRPERAVNPWARVPVDFGYGFNDWTDEPIDFGHGGRGW